MTKIKQELMTPEKKAGAACMQLVTFMVFHIFQCLNSIQAQDFFTVPEECMRPYVAGFFALNSLPFKEVLTATYTVGNDGNPKDISVQASVKLPKLSKHVRRSLVKWRFKNHVAGQKLVTEFTISNQRHEHSGDCRSLTLYDFSSMSEIEMRTFQELRNKH